MAEEEAAAAQETSAAEEQEGTAKSKSKPAATLEDMFKQHASKASGAEATSADISKWCKDAGVVGKTCDSGHVDISFTKVKQKTAKLVDNYCIMPGFHHSIAVLPLPFRRSRKAPFTATQLNSTQLNSTSS